jgi:phosphomannomutase
MAAPSQSLASIFKAYDIRGTVPDQLNAGIVEAIGEGFARFVAGEGCKSVVVGRDMRESGVELAAALMNGAARAGADVTDIGLVSTDLLYFASGHLEAAGAMLTASHNPARYNGVKLCLPGARPIGEESGLVTIRQMAEEVLDGTAGATGDGSNPTVRRLDLLDEFAAHVRSFVDTSRLRHLRIVADTANGMGGLVAPRVFDTLPFEVEILFGELDGTFPNHPADPIQPENQRFLRQRVLESGADVGLAFDGDADRVFLVDEKGIGLSGSLTTSIVAKSMLEKNPGATILYNLICSKAVPEVIRENGGVPVRTRVGHSFIKAVMAETGAVFGGEHSGHYYFERNYRADSGIIAALVVLEVICDAAAPLSEVRVPFERYADSGEINTEVPDPHAIIDEIARRYGEVGASVDFLDGLTADLGEWWFNLRPSNTEPLLRLNVEAADPPACKLHTDEVLALVHDLALRKDA